jgi:ketosteroid isomerase-like protein
MRTILCLLFFSVVAVFAQERTASPPSSKDQEELLKLEKTWNDAHVQGDVDALDRLWAEELVVTVPEMPVLDKAQSMRIWRTGRMKFQRYETSDVKARVFGDAAVVTGRLLRDRKMDERDVQDDWRFTKVYVRRGGKWQVVAWHASQAAK